MTPGGNPRAWNEKLRRSLHSLRPRTKASVSIVTYYAALPFKLMDDGSVGRGDAIECPSAETAIVSGEILSRIGGNIGVVAFSRTGDPDTGQFEDVVLLRHLAMCRADDDLLIDTE